MTLHLFCVYLVFVHCTSKISGICHTYEDTSTTPVGYLQSYILLKYFYSTVIN